MPTSARVMGLFKGSDKTFDFLSPPCFNNPASFCALINSPIRRSARIGSTVEPPPSTARVLQFNCHPITVPAAAT